jgi:hypothetical protein
MHMDTVHCDERRHECEMCTQTFKHQTNLTAHTHGDDIRQACTTCSHTFTTSSNLSGHMVRVHSEERYTSICITCITSFSRKDNLDVHLARVHNMPYMFHFYNHIFLEDNTSHMATHLLIRHVYTEHGLFLCTCLVYGG